MRVVVSITRSDFGRILFTMSDRSSLRFMVLAFLFLVSSVSAYITFADGNTNELLVAFLDVGQGDAIYIQSPSGHDMLIDGGREDGKVLAGLASVMSAADRHIDVVLATHSDADHVGGLPEVLSRFSVGSIVVSGNVSKTGVAEAFERAAETEGVPIVYGIRGTTIDLGGGVVFQVLFPDRNPRGWESNTASIVGVLRFGSTSALFTGDSPLAVEEYLVTEDGTHLDVDVLKLGHHGSDTSTAEVFLQATSPHYAVVSAGKDNQYGHPKPIVIERVREAGACVLSTADLGHISLYSDGRTWTTTDVCATALSQFDSNKK